MLAWVFFSIPIKTLLIIYNSNKERNQTLILQNHTTDEPHFSAA
jgi:hypothetical protein